MNSHNNLWRLIGALILAASLLLLWILGYGPGGRHTTNGTCCGAEQSITTHSTATMAPAVVAPIVESKVAASSDCSEFNFNNGKSFVMNFPSGSHALTANEEKTLERMAACIDGDVEIDGHTDNVGTTESNLNLSQKRAKAVVDYLVKKGVPKERFVVKSFGESQPIASNDTAEGRSQNRRIEFTED
jgi:outer membrane protein OmpA-like peptidoglycan-associated protein